MFVTDLNLRERTRYAEMLRGVAKYAAETADKLQAEPYEDDKFVLSFILLSMILAPLSELSKIVHESAKKEVPPEFPSHIDG